MGNINNKNFNFLKNEIFKNHQLKKDPYFKSLIDIEFEQFEYLSKDKQLAIYLHCKLCYHTEGCIYYYEKKDEDIDWNGYEHKKYLEKARKILSLTEDIELIINLIKTLNE